MVFRRTKMLRDRRMSSLGSKTQRASIEAKSAKREFYPVLSDCRWLSARYYFQLRKDVVVIVTKYDRLARSLRDLFEIVEAIRERGAGCQSLGEEIDTTPPTGRLIFPVFGSIVEFEREHSVERTKEGLATAKAVRTNRR